MDKKIKIITWIGIFLLLIFGVRGCSYIVKKSSYRKKLKQQKKLEKIELASLRNSVESFLDEVGSKYEVNEKPLTYNIKLEEDVRLDISSEVFNKESLKKGNEEEITFKNMEDKVVLDIKITYFIPIKLAILIDDVGMNTSVAQDFLKANMNLSFAVLPFLPKSREANEILRENGYVTILHMPMEGSNDRLNSRTPGLISSSMKKEKIYNMFDAAIENVGQVEGFNNHMGSRFTSNEPKMKELLKYAADKKLFYVDSKTSINNVGYDIAKSYGIKTYYCSHFLDNDKDVEKIKNEIRFSVKLAKEKGKTLVIGHYHRNMAKALIDMRDYIEKENVKLVSVKEILE